MTRRRKLLLTGAGFILAATGVAVGLAVSSPSPKPKAVLKPKVKIYTPPKTINTTCKTDDTKALGTWLLSVPDGAPHHDTVAQLKKGACYEVDGSIWWRGARNIVLNGNGATFRQAKPDPTGSHVTIGGLDNPDVAPYCGSTSFENDSRSALGQVVLMLSLEGGCDMTIENLTIDGTHLKGGDPAPGSFYQPASFLSIYGTQRVLIKDVTERGPYGDFVTIDGLHEAASHYGKYPATDVTIEHCNFTDAGRTGISETNGAQRVLIEDNTLSGAALTMFDIEQDALGSNYNEEDIDITHNSIVGQAYGFLVAGDTGSAIQRIAFTDNTLTKGAQIRITFTPPDSGGMINNSIVIEGNTSTAASTWPNRSPVNISNVYGPSVLVADNTDPAPVDGGKGHPFARLPAGALACGNTDPKQGTALDGACPATLPVIAAPEAAVLPN